MVRLIIMCFFFLLSLLTIFSAPTNLLWYVAILVTEFPLIFISLTCLLLFWKFGNSKYYFITSVTGIASLVLFALPIINAYTIAPTLKAIAPAFNKGTGTPASNHENAFSFSKMLTGINANQVTYKTLTYDTANALTLDFYANATNSIKPCIVVVHGGSWAGGNSRQLPELNSELAKGGYNVASINYRLAPKYKFPAPVEDLKAALAYMRLNAEVLKIDTNNFVLLGRSAGGQIVLSAAYLLNDSSIKGVVSFYGPADMVWGYANPTNPLVLNSRKVMEDYLGGTYDEVPQQYVNSSATETATSRSVPTLLIHGKNDPLVSYEHGTRLSVELDELSVSHYELYLPWATHGFDYTLNGPGGQLSTYAVMQFLQQVVHRP